MTIMEYIISYLPDDEELEKFMKDIIFPVL
jgi:hypothetical protein